MVEKNKAINLRDAGYSNRIIFEDVKIQDEIVEIACEKAPNTVTLGTIGLIGGAFLGGRAGALVGAVVGSLTGFLLDEENQSVS